MEASTFNTLAFKLGITQDHILKKAEELVRRTESKSKNSPLSALNASSTSISVMCIELAAAHNSHHVDRETAIRLSTLPKKTYLTVYKFVQQMLDMKQDMSISNLSVQFGCSEAKKLAEQILARYLLSHNNVDISEVNGELHNAAALYTACKKLKLKIDKSKLVAGICVKRSIFDRLVLLFEKMEAESLVAKKNDVTSEKADLSKSLVESLQDMYDAMDDDEAISDAQTKNIDDVGEEEEPFHVWRERILSQAKAALGSEETKC